MNSEILTNADLAHSRQRSIWNEEHRNPFMFPFVDSSVPNPGVVEFWRWLAEHGKRPPCTGLEICCGKGRNTIWMAGRSARMSGFDFSEIAIQEAETRQSKLPLEIRVDFKVCDATGSWPYDDEAFDFVVDCFGSSDIESEQGRIHVMKEAERVLKPGGHYFLQIDSPEMGFFLDRMNEAPGFERNTLVFPNGKVEAFLTEDDIVAWNHSLELVEVRREIETALEIFGQATPYKYYWIVAKKRLTVSRY